MSDEKAKAFCDVVRDFAFRLQVQSISPRDIEVIVKEPEDWMTLLSAVLNVIPGIYRGEDYGNGVFRFAGLTFINPTLRDYDGARYVEVWSRAMVA